MQIFLTALLTCLLAFGAAGGARADFASKADYAILMDADTRAVLFEKSADKLMEPASMSKLMTLALVFRALDDGKLNLDSEFIVSERAWREGGGPSGTSAMFVPLNSTVKLGDLLQGIIVQSGNDACIVIAEGMAGSEEAFADLMTDYGRKLGLSQSIFTNSSGLPPDAKQGNSQRPKTLMTARELGVLALHIIKDHQKYYHYFSQKEYRYRKHVFHSRNPLIYLNIGADGLKTGYTSDSGYGIVASAQNQNRRLVAVLNGLESQSDRKEEAVRLLNWGFTSFRPHKLFNKDEVVGEARVWGGSKRYVTLKGKGDVKILLPLIMREKKVEAKIIYHGPLKPPIKEGEKVAELRVNAGGVTNAIPLYAAEPVGKGGVVSQGLDSLIMLAFGWLL